MAQDRVFIKASNMVRLDGFTSTITGVSEEYDSVKRGTKRVMAVLGNVGSTTLALVLPLKAREGVGLTGAPFTVGAAKKLSIISFPENYESPQLDANGDHVILANASAALKAANFDWN